MKAFIRDILVTLLLAAILVFGMQATVQKFDVIGPSMDSTLRDGQQLLVNKVVYKFHQPERGDIIILIPPENEDEEYIKRIIGLPGESVEIKDGAVLIHKQDGSIMPLDEPYITSPTRRPFKGDVIPENEYFVLGDNRNNSSDSRLGWTVPRQNIIGKAWLSIWPPDKWGLTPNHSFQE